MQINENLNNSIIIIPTNIKNKIIKYINNLPELTNTKVLTEKEFIDNLTFTYDEKTIYYLTKKEHISYNSAIELINNIKLIYNYNDNTKNSKIIRLINLKNNLIEKELIYQNKYFKNYLLNKNIYMYGFDYINKYLKKLIKDNNLNIKIIEKNQKLYEPEILLFKNVTDEIEYIAEDIIKKNLILNKTYIYGINNDNKNIIKRIFNSYNIPINFSDNTTLYEVPIAKNILNNLNNVEEYLNTITNQDIKNELITIINKYYFINDLNSIKDILKSELKNTKIKTTKLENAINEIDIKNNIIEDDENIYIINFNNEYIPSLQKDIEYLSDKEKPEYLETSIELNNIEKNQINKIISNIKNLTITASKNNYNGQLNISTIATDYNYKISEKEKEISNYSNKINKYNLATMLDNYTKYNIQDDNQNILLNTYKDFEYKKYNNKYQKIDFNDYFTLSYSKINSYFECNFKYYCQNILKLDKYEDSYDTYIGSMCHYILSNIYNEDYDINKCIEEYKKTTKYIETNENKLFTKKIINELKDAITFIKSTNKITKFNEIECEKRIETIIDNVKFIGIVDKIQKYKNNIIIIDYKTGTPTININLCKYGFNLQLPVYILLIKSIYPESNIVGVYIEHILKPKTSYNDNKTDNELYEESLKLQGYTISDEDIIEDIDFTYENSTYIKGLKKSSNGFYKYTKLLSKEQFNELENLINNIIKECINNIKNSNFDINPTILNGKNMSCPNCKFKSICHHTEKDYRYITEEEGENNAELD